MIPGRVEAARQGRWGIAMLAVALLATAATPAAQDGGTRTVYGVYISSDGQTVDCSRAIGECLRLQGDEVAALIGLTDDTGHTPTSANYRFLDAEGTLLQTEDFCDRTAVAVPATATQLVIAVRALDPIGCEAGVARGTTGHVEVEYTLHGGTGTAELDVDPHECLEPTPAAVSVDGVTDGGQDVDLDVLVLLDGVSIERGKHVLQVAAAPYEPLGIDLVASFRPVSLVGQGGSTDSQFLLGQARESVGGQVPKGFDLVHTLTAKGMNVHGMADCLGGVRYPSRGFSVSTDIADRNIIYAGPIQGGLMVDYASTLVAHEIGHLVGGHHHLGNDVEGGELDPFGGQSTIMASPAFFPRGPNFSSVNGSIIRGHMVEYASP